MRLLGILDAAGSGLRAHQVALRTAGHNIANVNTPGFSRQRVTLDPVTPEPAPMGYFLGSGVIATNLRGQRDEFVERQLVVENGSLGAAEARQRPLARMDALFNEMNGEGLHRALERFFNSLRNLQANPESMDHRATVRSSAEILTERIRETAAALDELRTDLNTNIADEVTQINRLTSEVADLNDRISAVEASGNEASDLRDRRQVALADLGTRVGITHFEDHNGRVVVVGPSGKPLVEAGVAARLEVQPDATGLARIIHVSPGGRQVDITADIDSGKLAGLLRARDVDILSLRDDLDEFVFTFANRFNATHRAGVGLDGTTNVDFFTPPAVQAGAAVAFDLDAAILNGTQGLRDVGAALDAAALPGDNRNAIAMSDLQHDPTFFGGVATPGERLARMVRDVGAASRNNSFDLEFQELKVEQLENLRDSVSGVSLDEEMLDLVKFQNAFQASARVVRVVDELLDVTLDLKR